MKNKPFNVINLNLMIYKETWNFLLLTLCCGLLIE